MNKGLISNILRKLGLIRFTDNIRYIIQSYKNRTSNKEFIKLNPNVKLPPNYLMYESFQLNYKKYLEGGKSTAKWLLNILKDHHDLKGIKILDWGCGPARVVRHLPDLLDEKSDVFGTDYNSESIRWCKNNITDVNFQTNTIKPKLTYQDEFFDVIYGISIFTHLSEDMHGNWFKELMRILKPNGLLFITTQGDNFKSKLTKYEKAQFNKGELIVRGNVKEGHRTYSAFHPELYIKRLTQSYNILAHIKEDVHEGYSIPQDVWIVQK